MEDKTETRKSGINHLAFGSIIFTWGFLLLLKQVGIIDQNVSTLPFVITAFGAMLVAAGVIKLSRSGHAEID
jgi:hypothetical protein